MRKLILILLASLLDFPLPSAALAGRRPALIATARSSSERRRKPTGQRNGLIFGHSLTTGR